MCLQCKQPKFKTSFPTNSWVRKQRTVCLHFIPICLLLQSLIEVQVSWFIGNSEKRNHQYHPGLELPSHQCAAGSLLPLSQNPQCRHAEEGSGSLGSPMGSPMGWGTEREGEGAVRHTVSIDLPLSRISASSQLLDVHRHGFKEMPRL